MGIVTNILPQVGIHVKLPFDCVGTICVTDIFDNYKPNPLVAYSKDQIIRSAHLELKYKYQCMSCLYTSVLFSPQVLPLRL